MDKLEISVFLIIYLYFRVGGSWGWESFLFPTLKKIDLRLLNAYIINTLSLIQAELNLCLDQFLVFRFK